MYMAFTDESELKVFLKNKKDWKKWIEQQKAYGDRINVGSRTLTNKEIEKLMKEE